MLPRMGGERGADLLGRMLGGEEANPIMRFVLKGGYFQFAVVKMVVTILGLLFALIHIRFRYVRQILIVVFILSALLYGYHLYLRLYLP